MKGVTEKTLYRKCKAVEERGPMALLDARLLKRLAALKDSERRRGLSQA